MKTRTVLSALVAIPLFIGCENPTEPEPEKSFWEYAGSENENEIPYALEITDILVSGNYWLIGTLDAGLKVAENNGKWSTYQYLPNEPIFTIAESSDKYWLGTDGKWNFPGIRRGDDPYTWEWAGLQELNVLSIAVHPYNVFAGTDKGLFRTRNYGETWISQYNIDKLMKSKVTALLIKDRDVFAGTDKGNLFFSDNVGDSWVEIDAPSSSSINVISAAPNGNILIGADGVYYSSDNGETWKKSLTYHTSDFTAHNGMVYAGTEDGVHMSHDNGEKWMTFETDGLEDLFVTALAVTGDGHLLAGTASKGLFITTDPIE